MTTHDDIVTAGLKASVKVIMNMVTDKALSLGLGGMVIVVVDETGEYCACEMVSNVTDQQIADAVLSSAIAIHES